MKKNKNTVKPRRVKAVATDSYLPTRVNPHLNDYKWLPVWELPRTAAAYDAMVEQIRWAKGFGGEDIEYTAAIAALRAIGITRPKEDKP